MDATIEEVADDVFDVAVRDLECLSRGHRQDSAELMSKERMASESRTALPSDLTRDWKTLYPFQAGA